LAEAQVLTKNGIKYVFEGANFPTTPEAMAYFKKNGVILGPAIAANAGGVAVSELEMTQNSSRLLWTKEKVDNKLKEIMQNIHTKSVEAAEKYGLGYDLVAGANIDGFEKVAEDMIAQGTY
jgi:glutamate dehydrogenase (NADP+)